MSFINPKTKEINCKIVYYGPALAGKTTSLRRIYDEAKRGAKGEMISLSQGDDHTLFFDFVPLNLGKIRGHTVRVHLYTVPGETGYDQSRTLIAKGIDGVVFVADSQLQRFEENLKSLANLKEILRKEGHAWGDLPCCFAYNKRDLPDAVAVGELRHYLNPDSRDEIETVAITGQGVFEAFRAATAAVLRDLRNIDLSD